MGGCALETSSFAELTRQVLTLGVPVGAVLEGGYDLDALAEGVETTMEALADGRRAGLPPRASAVTERAREVLGALLGSSERQCAGTTCCG